MNGAELGGWLEPRLRAAPQELAQAVRELVGGLEASATCDANVSTVLARAAMKGLDEVAGSGEVREAALRLLAADASLTYAFEAAASLDLDVEGLARRVGVRGALGERLAAMSNPEPGGGKR